MLKTLFLFLPFALMAQNPNPYSISPVSGTGLTQAFTVSVQDTQFNDGHNIKEIDLDFNPGVGTTRPQMHVAIFPGYNVNGWLEIFDDNYHQIGSGIVPNSGQILTGPHGSLNSNGAGFSYNGSTVTVTLPITFNTAFTGTMNADVWAITQDWQHSTGYWTLGHWSPVLAGPPSISMTLGAGSTTAHQVFQLQSTDSAGWGDIDHARVTFSNTLAPNFAAPNICSLWLSRGGWFTLLDDSGTTWLTPYTTFGTAGTLHNSQCLVDAQPSSYAGNGNVLTWNVSVTAYPAFVGTKYIYGVASNNAGQNSDFVNFGSWTISGGDFGGQWVPLAVAGGVMQANDYDGGQSTTETSAGLLIVHTKTSNKTIKLAHAGNVKVSKVGYSHSPDDDAIKYKFHWDTTGGTTYIRLGSSWDNDFAYENANGFQEVGFTISPHEQPAGWIGMSVGWVALADLVPTFNTRAAKAVDSEFSVSSHYLPGLMAAYFMDKNVLTPIPLTGDREDDLAVTKAGSFMTNSHREFVIGPAFSPAATKEEITATVEHWVDDYGFTVFAPFLHGASADSIVPGTDLERDALEGLKAVLMLEKTKEVVTKEK